MHAQIMMIVHWDRDGKREESEPMPILKANALVKDGREAYGSLKCWMLPAPGDDADLLQRARAQAVRR